MNPRQLRFHHAARGLSIAALAVVAVASSACGEMSLTVLTQAPPGRIASLDIDDARLTLTRGLAAVVECREFGFDFSGPCDELEVTLDDDAVDAVGVFQTVLDAGPGQVEGGYRDGSSSDYLAGPTERRGVTLTAENVGVGTVTFSSRASPVTLEVEVIAPPSDPAQDDDDAEQ